MKRILLPTMLALNSVSAFAYSNLSQQVAAQRAQQLNDVSYQLSLSLDKAATSFGGVNVINFNLLDDSRDVVMDFDGKLVSSVSINGKPINDFTYDDKDENIVLPKKWLAKGKNEVKIAYEANFTHHGAGLHQYKDPADGNEYFYTDFETADSHRMFPNFDQPSIKATFTLDVEAPVDWQLVSNMPEVKMTLQDGRKHSYFATTQKISTYIMHLSAGPYAMWQDNSGKYPMRVYARQSLAQYVDADNIFATTKKGLTFFEDYYGYDYPFSKYDQLLVPEFNAGAMENAGAVTMLERFIFRTPPTQALRDAREVTILHEMAHMWFGDLVTMKWWNDLWLNESFADFMGYVGMEGIGIENSWSKAQQRKKWAYLEDQLMTTHPILSDIPDILSASANFDGITYAKGLAALRQLEYFIGPEKFKQGIRTYLKKHAFGNTNLNDFIAALESAHGAKLTEWVKLWLGTKDVNSIKLSFDNKGGKIANAQIHQSGGRHDSTLRPHANLVGLYYLENGKLQLKDKVKIEFSTALTDLPRLNGKAMPALILPNIDDYDYVKIRLDANSLDWLKKNMSLVTDTATKNIIWATLWDMVRDGEMNTRDYFNMAINSVENEQDVDVLNTLLRSLRRVVNTYTADINERNKMRDRFYQISGKMIRQVTPASDLQRAWYRMFLFATNQQQHFAYLAKLYDGAEVINGITLNNERKWDILEVFAKHNQQALVEKRMSQLLQQDPSARSKNMALTVEASYPRPEVKEKVWQTLTQQSDYSLLQKRFIGEGLYNDDHPELAKPYIKRYFKAIEALHQNNENYESASYLIRVLYPDFGMEETVIQTEQFLATSEVPKTYKTLVMKSLDELKRTINVRKKNL